MEATLEPVSPELVLVTPGLRRLLVEGREAGDDGVLALQRRSDELPTPTPAVTSLRSRLSLITQFALYAGWQAVTGALFGLAAFAIFIALLLLKSFIAG